MKPEGHDHGPGPGIEHKTQYEGDQGEKNSKHGVCKNGDAPEEEANGHEAMSGVRNPELDEADRKNAHECQKLVFPNRMDQPRDAKAL